MAVYVAEIDGKAIAAFAADSKMRADEFVGGKNNTSNAFRADLSAFELWDRTSEILARPADSRESEQWHSSFSRARQDGEAEDEDENDWLCFFVDGATKSRQDFGRTNWTLKDVSKVLSDIDLAMLMTQTEDGQIAGRPMSNNRDVEFNCDSFFLTSDQTRMVADIERNKNVALSYCRQGTPTIFITVQGEAELIRDEKAFKKHWTPSLTRWFPRGLDSPHLILIKVHASRIHYWDGSKEGEVCI